MNSRDFSRSVRRAEATLRELGLIEEVRLLTSLTPSPEFRRVAFDPDASYAELYRIGLASYDYNVLLSDLSYFQFHCMEGGIRPGVRYAFYPNPYPTIRFSEFYEEHILTMEDVTYEHYLQHLSEIEEQIRVPLLRFDLAVADYTPLEHPAAHLHIGHHEDNRWPCARTITPHAFVLLVTKLYYSNAWVSKRATCDALLMSEKAASVSLAPSLFSQDEERQFYFG